MTRKGKENITPTEYRLTSHALDQEREPIDQERKLIDKMNETFPFHIWKTTFPFLNNLKEFVRQIAVVPALLKSMAC